MPKRGPKPRTAANSRREPPPSPWAGFLASPHLDDEGRAEFNRLVVALRKRGLLDATDPRMVVLAAQLHSMIHKAGTELAESKFTHHAPNGALMPHPMVGTIANLCMRLRAILKDLFGKPKPDKPQASGDVAASRWEGVLNVAG